MEVVASPGRHVLDQRIDILKDALNAVVVGEAKAAEITLRQIQNGVCGKVVSRSLTPRMQLTVFMRDKFTCRYCGKRTVFVPILRALSFRYPEILPYHPNWKWNSCHPIYWTHSASCDHLIPIARGGTNELGNLVTACYMCNSTKQNWLLHELGWSLFPISDVQWDGLLGYYRRLCEVTEVVGQPHHRKWLQALTRVSESGVNSGELRSVSAGSGLASAISACLALRRSRNA